MLSSHLSPVQIDLYLRQQLAPDELERVDDHLTECVGCRYLLGGKWESGPAQAVWTQICWEPQEERIPLNLGWPGALIESARRRWAFWLSTAAVVLIVLSVAWTALWRFRATLSDGSLTGETAPMPRVVRPGVVRLRETRKDFNHVHAGSSAFETKEVEIPRVVLVDGGRRIGLAADGTLQGLEQLSSRLQAIVATALMKGSFAMPTCVQELRGSTSSLRGGESSTSGPDPLSPVATLVLNDVPTFRWRSSPGAHAYLVTVFDQHFSKVAASGLFGGQEWTPAQPLPRGQVLAWQVTAILDSHEVTAPASPAPEARFRILMSEEMDRVRRVAGSVRGSRLARAAIYADAGLLEDAEKELGYLAAANSGSEVLRSLMASLRASRAPS